MERYSGQMAMGNDRILLVDDDNHLLESIQRVFRKRFPLDTAKSGAEALEKIKLSGPYAVIVSDMKMPNMNGIELLSAVKALAPHTVRIMLTGNADVQTAADAINEGDIFRLINKPCESAQLLKVLEAAIEQHRLLRAEQDLLENTLRGSIKAITEVLSFVNPAAFGLTSRLVRHVREIAEKLQCSEAIWELETMAYLSQIGCVILSEEVLRKRATGQPLTEEENQLFNMHPSVGSDLVGRIPRLEDVANCIRLQEKCYDGSGIPHDAIKGDQIPLGARILKVVLDIDQMESAGLSPEEAVKRIGAHRNRYDPKVLAALIEIVGQSNVKPVQVKLNQLTDDMILADDIKTQNGVLVMCKGQHISISAREYLMKFWMDQLIPDTLTVICGQRKS